MRLHPAGPRRAAVPGRRARVPATLAIAIALLAWSAQPVAAQDTTFKEGVRIGLRYDPGIRPNVLVLPVPGANGDSVRALLQRDLDYGDAVLVMYGNLATAAEGAAGGNAPGGTDAPNYPLLAKLGTNVLIRATLAPSALHIAVHDVAAARVAQVRDFPLSATPLSSEWRMELHAASDEIGRWISGRSGVSATRIVFVRDGQIWMIDSDGANARAVSDRGTALSPAWSPNGRSIAYSAFGERGTQIVVRDLVEGTSRWLSATPGGLNITPIFSPDGAAIVYAHGEENGTDLVSASPFESGPARRVTVGHGSDNVSPTFSPDGRRIAFTSGRSGHPEVYITDVDGTNADLLTPYAFGDQYYRSNPDWSPDGRVIAFQSQINGTFQVMTINLRDRGIRQLTSEGRNEDPSWAPDARHLVLTSTRSGTRELFVLDVESGRVRQLTFGSAARLAAWSPLLARAGR
jgi:TolB protein